MSPSTPDSATPALDEEEQSLPKLIAPQAAPRKYHVLYFNILVFLYAHLAAFHGLYLSWTIVTWKTLIFSLVIYILAMIGVTAGAHRLWSHRAYKAKLPLQILLMVMYTFAFQYTVMDWVRNHRVHHRYSDTDADPHNSTRGFFFCHIGWMFVKKHPEVIRRGKFTDMSDIHANPVLSFQKKYAIPFMGTVSVVLPVAIPMYFFGETLVTAWDINMMRIMITLHSTFLINSFSHLWGTRPYDKNIQPVQNLIVSLFAFGEGYHNYHHTYPWDYRAGELGNNWLNVSAKFIDLFAWIGWAYDLKTVPDNIIRSRSARTGDGSNMWGFQCGDNNM